MQKNENIGNSNLYPKMQFFLKKKKNLFQASFGTLDLCDQKLLDISLKKSGEKKYLNKKEYHYQNVPQQYNDMNYYLRNLKTKLEQLQRQQDSINEDNFSEVNTELIEEMKMADITASMVKELRDRTGLGMMDCKKALTEAGGDIEVAIDNMRKSGQAKAAKKAAVTTK